MSLSGSSVLSERQGPAIGPARRRRDGTMTTIEVEGSGTPAEPWSLTTPSGTSQFESYRDPDADPPALVVQVGTTELRYHLRCIDDLHQMLVARRDWMPLGNADEQKPAKP